LAVLIDACILHGAVRVISASNFNREEHWLEINEKYKQKSNDPKI